MASAYFYRGSIIESLTSTPSSGGNLALNNASDHYQIITGTQAHTVTMPDATTLVVGIRYEITNASTQAVTVNAFGGALLGTVEAGSTRIFRATDISTSAGTYDVSTASAGAAGLSTAESFQFAALAAKGFTAQSRVVKYNPDEVSGNYWLTKSSLPTNRVHGGPINTINGYGYVLAGQNTEAGAVISDNTRYSDDNNYFLAKTAMITARTFVGSFVISSLGYAWGGGYSGGSTSGLTESYNDGTDSWTARATNATAKTQQQTSAELGGFGYSFGGAIAGSPTSINNRYDPTSNVWVILAAPFPSANYDGSLCKVNERLIYAGGNAGGATAATYSYSAPLNCFVTELSMPIVTNRTGAFAIYDSMYVVSGYSPTNTAIYRYSDTVRAWDRVANGNVTGHQYPFCGTINGIGYAVGGQDSGFTVLASNYSFIPSALFSLGSLKKSVAVPTTIAVAAVLNSLSPNTQVQLRTDGDNWKTFMSGQTSLKTGEILAAKFQPSGIGHVAGGHVGAGMTASATVEAYNFVQNVWVSRNPLNLIRYLQCGTHQDGYGYSFGGNNGSDIKVASAERLDEITNSSLTLSASMPVALDQAAGGILNGYMYITGGSNATPTIVGTHYRYNNTLDSYSTMTSLTSARATPAANSVIGRYIVSGGSGSSPTVKSDSELYNDATNTWSAAAAVLSPARYVTAGGVLDGYAYVVGGRDATLAADVNTAAKWNPITDSFTNTPVMSNALYLPNVFRNSGFLFRCGGNDSFGAGNLSSVQYYNPQANTWTTAASMSTQRFRGSNNFAPGPYRNYELRVAVPAFYAGVSGNVWVTKANMLQASSNGGSIGSLEGKTLNTYSSDGTTTQIYDILSNVWTNWVSNPVANSSGGMSGFTLGGQAYSINRLVSMYAANPVTKSWTARAADIFDRFRVLQPHGTALNGYGYMYGGDQANSSTYLNHADRYDQSANSWLNRASTSSTASRYCGGFTLNSAWYIKMGDNGAYTTAFESYNDAANLWTAKAAYPTATGQQAALITQGFALMFGGYGGSYSSSSYLYSDALNSWMTMPNDFRGGYINGCTDSNTGLSFGGDTGSPIASAYQYAPSIKQALLSAGLTVT